MRYRTDPKIVLVGAGSSSFGPITLSDLFTNVYRAGGDLVLVDIDEQALERVYAVAQRIDEGLATGVTVSRSTRVDETAADADFVIIAAEEDRIERWRADWELLARFDMKHTLAENRGPAGLSHTLRTVPLVLNICRNVEVYAPHAVVLVMTNPEDRIAYAVNKYTDLTCYGYCDGLWDFKNNYLRPVLGIPGELIHVEAAGINHAVWIDRISHVDTGEDLYPTLISHARNEGWQPLGLHLYETFGQWPHENDEHYGEYFSYACEYVDCKGYDFDGHLAKDREWKTRMERLAHDPARLDAFQSDVQSEAWAVFGDAPPSLLMRGLTAGAGVVFPNANVSNRGKIPGLPEDMIVEVPALVSPGGVRGVQWPDLPREILPLLHREGEIQRLAAEAAAEASRVKALQALALDPHVSSPKAAEELLDAFLEEHAGFVSPALGPSPDGTGRQQEIPR